MKTAFSERKKKALSVLFNRSRESFLVKHKTSILLSLPLILGVLSGIFLSCRFEGGTENGISALVQAFLKRRNEPIFWQEFLYSFESVFLAFALIYLCGISLVGSILIPCILMVRGMGIGAVAGNLCMQYGTSGLLYIFFMILPFTAVTSCLLVVMSREGMRFSGKLLRVFSGDENVLLKRQFVKYCMRSGILIVLLIAASFTDGVLCTVLCGIFRMNV